MNVKKITLDYVKKVIKSRLNKYTKKAYFNLPDINKPFILDAGCGTGTQTIELAKLSGGIIIALDINLNLLKELTFDIENSNLHNNVLILAGSARNLPFKREVFDIIWSEGISSAIDFDSILKEWRDFIKPNGFLVIHDDKRNLEEKIKSIVNYEYIFLNKFELSGNIWWHEYYGPMEKMMSDLDEETIKAEGFDRVKREINIIKNDPEQFGSLFYILKKPGPAEPDEDKNEEDNSTF